MSDSIIKIEGVNKWFGDFQVLKDINLEVQQKQKIVVCGPSGSGKSTLIRCINRLEEHQKGKIVVDCEPEIAISRLITYRSFKEADARARIDKQATRDQRNKHADFMINNNGHEESLNEQVEACWGWMQSLVKGKSNQ